MRTTEQTDGPGDYLSGLLDEPRRTLLRAATRDDEVGLAAFKAWRRSVRLDDIDYPTHRVMPMLVDRARGHGITDPDLDRMRGITRHIWTLNVMQLRNLFTVLEVLGHAGLRPLVMKGAALFARQPDLAAKRMSSDYDFLLPGGTLPQAIAALSAAGFAPETYDWEAIDASLIASETSGTGLTLHGKRASVDFHWRPLPTLLDPWLTDRLFQGATTIALRDREVLIPSPTHHLFLSMARCEPFDPAESFQRIVEGVLLVSGADAAIDWSEFRMLTHRYGIEMIAASYLDLMAADAAAILPPSVAEGFSRRASRLKQIEFEMRQQPPERRTPLQRWMIGWYDARYRRSHPDRARLRLHQALIEGSKTTRPWRLRSIWRWMRERHHGPSTGRLRFLEGWYYPERRGRWSRGSLAAIAVPLGEAQRQGAPVKLKVRVYFGRREMVDLQVTAGPETINMSFPKGTKVTEISLKAPPCPTLGGDALVLFSLPFGVSPFESGESDDQRVLGLFLFDS